MFEAVGFLVRLPFGVLGTVLLFLSWPLVGSLLVGWLLLQLLWAPIAFMAYAAAKDRNAWEKHKKEYIFGWVELLVYPFLLTPDVWKWVIGK